MDDIYDNLENYDDLNVINELKNENKELKIQLEKYSTTVAQLQKDFDKLNSEYKKLEINYSSLLKTARAEIERKADIIKTLNTEKDMLVIKSLQKRGVNILKAHRSNFNKKQQSVKNHRQDTDSGENKVKQNSVESTDNNKNNRLDSTRTPSVDTVATESTENKSTSSDEIKSKVLKNGHNYETRNKNKGEENVHTNIQKEDIQKSFSKKIMNRRKSMPATSFQNSRFSSDQDEEKCNTENITISPVQNERHDNRDYRRDSYNHYEPCKDSYRNRNSNHSDYNKHKFGDKYDPPHRPRRHRSPEQSYHKYGSDSSQNYNYRDNYKQRVLRSPPPDKYNRSKSRDRRHVEKYHDRDGHHDSSSLKHKIRDDCDESNSKRQKFDSYSQCPTQDNYTNEKEKEFERMKIFQEELSHSCQSPDYVFDNNFPQHFVKEIRNSSATNLEDPRITSKKYYLQTYKDKKSLSTVTSRNVDMKFIDKSIWGIEKVDVPEALKTRPSVHQESRDLISQVYMKFESTGLDESLESGVIPTEDDSDNIRSNTKKEYENKNKFNSNRKIKNEKVIDIIEPVVDTKLPQKPLSSTYKIPKVKKHDNTSKQSEVTTESDKTISSSNINVKVSVESTYINLKSKCDLTSQNDSICENHQINDRLQKGNKSVGMEKKKDNVVEKQKNNNVLEQKSIDTEKQKTDDVENKKYSKLPEQKRIDTGKVKCDDVEKQKNYVIEKQNINDVAKKKCNNVLEKKSIDTQKLKSDNVEKQNIYDVEKQNINDVDKQKYNNVPEQKSIDTEKLKRDDVEKQKNYDVEKQNINDADKQKYSSVPEQKSIDTEKLKRDDVEKQNNIAKQNINHLEKQKNNEVQKQKNYEVEKQKSSAIEKQKSNDVLKQKSSKPIIDKAILDILATVKGDLELSDEEDMDLQKPIIDKEKDKQDKIVLSENNDQKISAIKENQSNVPIISCEQNTEVTKKCLNLKKGSSSKELTREKKTRKCKRKTSDSNEVTFSVIEDPSIKEIKNNDSKKCKQRISKPKNSKFSDLFGDTSSLITPDDLGIPATDKKLQPDSKFPSMFDNTEDAVDLSVEDINKVQSTVVDAPFDAIINRLPNNEIIKKSRTVEAKVLNHNGENAEANLHMYENTKAEALTEAPNVVKTVIISTGAQPKSISNSTSDVIGTSHVDVNKFQAKICTLNDLKALATSTPNKHLVNINIPENNHYINGTNSSEVNFAHNGSELSVLYSAESQAETDVPDVRIFVRRRRKTIKKST